ncbi:GTPase-associated system all-helical protein GASH [Parachitinimonas caeni]|uniref:GTPase-associated system all-helical protein GASH n=1 Tax=Parachitinimonas caeni TaxID=3031301 RepID=A0ABT7E1N8_9NEIS|nr:GTPase-associated system all-helical protein GASH [Parachitinimonas caeni]MDK2126227.1 GTPase-associated system all-helical protein GASH [Parachitinimonas caeni]
MAQYSIADLYAKAFLAASPQQIIFRSTTVERVVSKPVPARTLDLAQIYFGLSEKKLDWFRDEFIKEDASFSLINNERETQLLATGILDQLVSFGDTIAILVLIVGHAMGKRPLPEFDWLLDNAQQSLSDYSVIFRAIEGVDTEIKPVIDQNLDKDDGQGDQALDTLNTVKRIRREAQQSSAAIAKSTSRALCELDCQIKLMREESQILWWLFGGYSKQLNQKFSDFSIHQAAILGAIDLGALTTYSELGPIAAPAVLERVIALGKKSKGATACELAKVIDSLPERALVQFNTTEQKLPPKLAPISTAISLASSCGKENWYSKYNEVTGLVASMECEPLQMAIQLYHELLLERHL